MGVRSAIRPATGEPLRQANGRRHRTSQHLCRRSKIQSVNLACRSSADAEIVSDRSNENRLCLAGLKDVAAGTRLSSALTFCDRGASIHVRTACIPQLVLGDLLGGTAVAVIRDLDFVAGGSGAAPGKQRVLPGLCQRERVADVIVMEVEHVEHEDSEDCLVDVDGRVCVQSGSRRRLCDARDAGNLQDRPQRFDSDLFPRPTCRQRVRKPCGDSGDRESRAESNAIGNGGVGVA